MDTKFQTLLTKLIDKSVMTSHRATGLESTCWPVRRAEHSRRDWTDPPPPRASRPAPLHSLPVTASLYSDADGKLSDSALEKLRATSSLVLLDLVHFFFFPSSGLCFFPSSSSPEPRGSSRCGCLPRYVAASSLWQWHVCDTAVRMGSTLLVDWTREDARVMVRGMARVGHVVSMSVVLWCHVCPDYTEVISHTQFVSVWRRVELSLTSAFTVSTSAPTVCDSKWKTVCCFFFFYHITKILDHVWCSICVCVCLCSCCGGPDFVFESSFLKSIIEPRL